VPVIKSVSATCGSFPTDDASRHRIGSYLALSQLQSIAHSSTLFLTASAQNLLCIQLAEACGVDVGNHFMVWAQGAFLPAIVGEWFSLVLGVKVGLRLRRRRGPEQSVDRSCNCGGCMGCGNEHPL